MGFAHVHDFDQRVHVGQLHIALGVGIGIAGVILAVEVRLVGKRLAGVDQVGAQLVIELVVDGGDLSAITFMRSDWARMPEAATAMEVEKSIVMLLL